MGVPLNHPFLFRNFPNKNHPAIRAPPIYGNPHTYQQEKTVLSEFSRRTVSTGRSTKPSTYPPGRNQSGSGELENPRSRKVIYDCLVDQYQVRLPEGIHHFKLENPTIQFPGKATLAGQSAHPKNDPPIRVFSPRDDPMTGGCPFSPCATAGPGCASVCTMCTRVWMDGWIAAGMHVYIQYTGDTRYIHTESNVCHVFCLSVQLQVITSMVVDLHTDSNPKKDTKVFPGPHG